MPHQVHGTFTIRLQPMPASGDGLARMSFEKALQGGLEGSSKGEMISAGDPQAGEAGYVAMERVEGTLEGRTGGFALQQFATMSGGGRTMQIEVVPGSGTGELAGIAGTFTITIVDGRHSYALAYSLPGK